MFNLAREPIYIKFDRKKSCVLLNLAPNNHWLESLQNSHIVSTSHGKAFSKIDKKHCDLGIF